MSLNHGRLKGKIVDVLDECQNESDNPNTSKNLLADRLAAAMIEEMKQMSISYNSGLVAPSSGGAVTGTLNVTIS